MDNSKFYDAIDKEIVEILEKYKEDEYISKQAENNKKAYAFLLWFLDNNLPKGYKSIDEYKEYIVDGNDDNSCDIIFDNEHNGEKIFYVVQVKWFSKSNINKSNDISKEFKACITDFQLILSGEKSESEVNEKFNQKYKELLEHKSGNNKIRFIFVALCKSPDEKRLQEIQDINSHELVQYYLCDIGMLKRRYIDMKYKGLLTLNPLEEPFEVNNRISLNIDKGNFIKIPAGKREESYIFIVNAKTVYELYNRYRNSIFIKNIRNPNKFENNTIISKTAKNNSDEFWYYNNGITAITNKIYPFYHDNDIVDIEGIQIINGAQTLYSVYEAYKSATSMEQENMEKNLKLTIRILGSSKIEGSDLSVTRYTNSQSIIIPRDFYCNDIIQENLYKDFLNNTDIIYERRRGEFKDCKELKVVSNEILGRLYLAYYLQQPLLTKSDKKCIFRLRDDNNGKYEDIFNQNTSYKDMLIAYYLHNFIDKKEKSLQREIKILSKKKKTLTNDEKIQLENREKIYSIIKCTSFEILALYKVILENIDEPQKTYGEVLGELKKIEVDEQYESERLNEYYEKIIGALLEAPIEGTAYSYFKTVSAYDSVKKILLKTLTTQDNI